MSSENHPTQGSAFNYSNPHSPPDIYYSKIMHLLASYRRLKDEQENISEADNCRKTIDDLFLSVKERFNNRRKGTITLQEMYDVTCETVKITRELTAKFPDEKSYTRLAIRALRSLLTYDRYFLDMTIFHEIAGLEKKLGTT